MRARLMGLLTLALLLGFSSPVAAQLACYDIFALTSLTASPPELRTIPMLERFRYERFEDSNVFYLRNASARARYEWFVKDGLFVQMREGKTQTVTTAVTKKDHRFDESLDTPLVEFVLSTSYQFFGMTRSEHLRIFDESAKSIHHSTFMGGGEVKFAGNVFLENGVVKRIDNRSGHYRPSLEDFVMFLTWLRAQGVDLSRAEIRIEDFDRMLENQVPFKIMEEHMPELVFIARVGSGMLHPGFFEALKERIDREFKETGDSTLLYRSNFVWDLMTPSARDFLTQVGRAHGKSMPDLSVQGPPSIF